MSHDPHALNPRQREAVLHGDGPLLILAGAGTGKTRTLAYRIAHLVERGVTPGTILAVAFTNKSADELKERVKKLIRKGAKVPSVSTFHSFCVRVLRGEIEHLGYKRNFTIYDTADQLSALKEALREVRLVGRGDADAKRVLAAISRAKNEGRELDPGDGTDPYAILAAETAPRYESALKAYNAVDFDDLLVLTLKLFREYPRTSSRAGASAAVTSSSTSSRTPTPSSTGSSRCWPAPAATSPWSATTTSRSTAGAARSPATSWISRRTGRRRR